MIKLLVVYVAFIAVLSADTLYAQDSLNVRRLSLWNAGANGVVLRDCYMYIPDAGGLHIIDVGNPAAPAEVGLASSFSNAICVTVGGNFAYVTTPFELHVIDISVPSAPVETGVVTTSTPIWGMAVSGGYVYLPVPDQGLVIIDVTNPAAPAVVSTFPLASELWAVAVDGNYAYVAASTLGLRVIDVSNPAIPVEVGFFASGDFYTVDVAIRGGYAYIADDYRLRILDISNPTTPMEVGSYSPNGSEYGVSISGNYAFLGCIEPGSVRALDISNPISPVEVGYYNIPSQYPARLSADGNLVAAIEIDAGLTGIYDVSVARGIGVPGSPDELVISLLPPTTDVRLDWSPVTLDTQGNPVSIAGYRIYSTNDPAESSWDFVGEPVPPTGITFIDTRVPVEQRRYQVRAVKQYEAVSCP